MEEKINILIYVITFLVIISGVNLIIGTSNNLPIIDPEITNALQTQYSVFAFVDLKDTSNFSYGGATSKEDRLRILKEKEVFNQKIQLEIVSSLSIDEMNVTFLSENGLGFSGNITAKGLEKLKNNSYISGILIPLKGSSENESDIEVEEDIWKELENSDWVSVIIKLYEKNDTLRDSILFMLSVDEFQLKEKQLREYGFVGNITRKGLEKLKLDLNVRTIYLDRMVSVANDSEEDFKEKDNKFWLWLTLLVILVASVYLIFKKIRK